MRLSDFPYMRTLRGITCATSLIAIVYFTWQIVVMELPAPSKLEITKIVPPMQSRKPDMDAASHIFGTSPKPINRISATPALDIKVTGILMAEHPESSIAIFDINGQQVALSTGANLPDGETIKEIAATSVMLSNDGQERRLDWEMHTAPMDVAFETLPVTGVSGDASSQTTLKYGTSKPVPYSPVAIRMTALRNQALQDLSERLKTAKHSSAVSGIVTLSKPSAEAPDHRPPPKD